MATQVQGCHFSPATKRVAPATFIGNRRKIEPKEIPSHLIPRLLVVFIRQLEILVTTLQVCVCSLWTLRWFQSSALEQVYCSIEFIVT